MRVLFVYTDIDVKGGARSYHFGVGILAAVLKKAGHEVDLHYMFDKWDTVAFEEHVDRFKPDILAYTADSTQIRHVSKLIDLVKDRGIFQIAGGVHPSLYPKTLESIDGLDAICAGEGEEPFLRLVSAMAAGDDYYHTPNMRFRKADGTIVENEKSAFIHDLNSIPFGNREIFNFQQIVDSDYDRATFMLSRGCPYKCTYCGAPAMGNLLEGKYTRFRSVENGIAEIKEVVAKYKIGSIFFADDVFTVDRKFVKAFSEAYAKEIGIPFEVTTRVEASTYETFKYLADAGCTRVAMGVESGNEEFRKKVLNRKMSNKKIVEVFKAARQAGIKTKSYNIVGFPYETREIHMDTVRINREMEPDSLVCYIFNPYPGTRLHDMAIEAGFLPKDFLEKEFISRTDTPLTMPDFTREDILDCYRNFAFNVYKEKSMSRALMYKVYYSKYGENLIRVFDYLKKPIRKLAMGS